jgi:ribosomal protein S18 acetylase RimI-like enzyme
MRDLLLRLNQSMISAGRRDREHFDVGAFHLMLLAGSDRPWTNFAVPVKESSSPAEVCQMVQAFRSRGKTPRVELLEPLWPDVNRLLLSEGFLAEMRLPLMICDRPVIAKNSPARPVSTQDEMIQVAMIEAEAFGHPFEVDQSAVNRRLERIREGNLVAALVRHDGERASSAMLTIDGDVMELVSVATRPKFQGRGLARQACELLLAHAFGTGEPLVWLSATAPKLYASLGFVPIGHQVNLTLPFTQENFSPSICGNIAK